MYAFGGENLSTVLGADRQEQDDGFIVFLDKSVMSRVFSMQNVLIIIHARKCNVVRVK